VFVETTDVISSTTDYFLYRISTASLVPKGRVTVPVQFFPVLPAPDPGGRMAWPHPDGESLVVPAAAEASVAAFNPATGGAAARTALQGGGPAVSLAFNDVSGFLYAREADGGWTVLSVPAGRGSAPVEAKKVDDATGLGSLRVIMGGSALVAAGASKLALIDGTAAGATAHTVIATVDLPLNPLGGPSFPQPAATWAARTYVTPPSATGPRLVFPLAGTVFCDAASPPDLEVAGSAGSGHLEVELGTQYDFLRAPGAPRGRFRVPAGATTVRPPAALWRKVLRAAAGSVERPFYARVNAVSRTGFRTWGDTASFRVCAPVPPTLSAPADGGAATMGAPPALSFDPLRPGRVRIEFAGPGGFADGVNAAFRVRAAAGGTATETVPAGTWGNAAERARRQNGDVLPVDVFWRVLVRDGLGRWVPSATRRLVLGP
jgi:hypothetical protein